MTPILLACTMGISVIFNLPPECQPGHDKYTSWYYNGCWVSSRPYLIYVNPKLKGRERTKTLLHELGHSQGHYSEEKADSYAGVMMKKYKW